ncbi:MAG: hypothetical protein KJ725_10520 [Gammaproteobacteria bacterium]|nr:hypothetical protein [Gammaproteobacteria bacterium]
MKLRQLLEGGSVARLTGVGSRADFCSCKICIHAIHGNQIPPSSLHGGIHGVLSSESPNRRKAYYL